MLKKLKRNKSLFILLFIWMIQSFCGCTTASEIPISVYAEVAPVKGNADAIFTLISDDGFYDSSVILNMLAHKYKMNVTVSGIVETIEPYLEEWKEIESQNYVELVSHSYSHLRISNEENISEEQVWHETIDAKNFYETYFKTNQFTFVPPENCVSDYQAELLKNEGFRAIRMGNRGYNSLSPEYNSEPFQWFNLGVKGIGDVDTTVKRNLWLDEAIQEKQWLIEMWHSISPNGDFNYQPISTKDAEEHLIYVAEKRNENKIWVASFTQAVKYIQERQNSKISATKSGNEIVVQLSLVEKMPEEFDAPLTVKVEIPADWEAIELIQDATPLPFRIVEESDKEYIITDLIPDQSPAILKCVAS